MSRKMMFSICTVMLVTVVGIASAGQVWQVDIGASGQPVEAGWTEWSEERIDPGPTTAQKSVDGLTITLAQSGGAGLAFRNGAGSELAGDLVCIDNLGGGEAVITLTISGLPPGNYIITSYHNFIFDPPAAVMDIKVNGEVKLSDVAATVGAGAGSGAKAACEFAASGDVLIEFVSTNGGNIPLNGFSLELAKPSIAFTVADSGDFETDAAAVFAVNLSEVLDEVATVDYAVTGGTATSDEDYAALAPATLVFAPGETAKTIELNIINDGADEEDETIELTLSNATGPEVQLGVIAQHTYTIIDPRPAVGFAEEAGSAQEDAGSVDIAVILSTASDEQITVDYAITGGTAAPGDDYTLADGSLTFAPGETAKTITIDLVDDEIEENPDETAEITLSNQTNAKLGIAQHVFTISDTWSGVMDFDRILFIRRNTLASSHYYTEFIDGTDGCFSGNIAVLDLKTNQAADVVPSLEGGVFGRCDLSFDAQKIVFDYKPRVGAGFRIWEVNVDGTGLRQLTFDPPDEQQRIERYNLGYANYRHHTDDMHPCYLPDGGICFTSTRPEYEILCDKPGKLTTCVLYRMDADGQNMEQLTRSSVSEFSPSVMNDGRIIYSRWEYVDKGSLCVKALWAMNPDGTKSVEIFGNDHRIPPSFIYPRQIPNKNNLFVCIGAPHYPQGPIGTVILVDTTRDIRTTDAMKHITPVRIVDEPGWEFWDDGRWRSDDDGKSGHLYKDPYPLSENLFLVSCKTDPGDQWDTRDGYDLYLMDDSAELTLVYADPRYSCWNPIPLKPRKKPIVINSVRIASLAEANQALCIVTDVYKGLDGVQRGTIKYLRINAQVPRPWEVHNPDDNQWVGQRTHLGLKVQYGIVPVEEDGSAYFKVAADMNIFFQALDENYMEVQRERTYVNYRPGEIRACIGCHEKTGSAPVPSTDREVPIAMTRPPSEPGPQPGEETGRRTLHYPRDVQPVWDRHCTSCHSGQHDPDLTDDMTDRFCRSYEELLDRRLVGVIVDEEEDHGMEFAEYLPPYSFGSYTSGLITLLRNGHYDVNLSQGEMVKVTTWVDSMGQYYGSYWGRHLRDDRGRDDFRPVSTFDEAVSHDSPHRN